MKAKPISVVSLVFGLLAVLSMSTLSLYAQCYLSQGCKPQDNLNYIPNGTGQVFHGDGASNNGSGGWTNYYSDVNQCLGCHYGTDTMPYLQTGHRNGFRKLAPGTVWGGPDAAQYPTTDPYYGSGSTFNWSTNLITLGWCDPLGTPAQNGLPAIDAVCQFPFYTLPNAQAPAPYTPVAQTQQAGGVRNLYYIFAGWMNYGGTANPTATHLNTVFDQGFTGEQYPNGNFDCGRCHATGYNFDNWAPEPTSNTNNQMLSLPDSSLKRLPSDGYIAPGTSGTSSWYLSGVQCEGCHQAAWGYGSHPNGGLQATIAHNEASTALCMQCHRGEVITQTTPDQPGSIVPAQGPLTSDHGFCSDLSGAAYAACIQNPSSKWVYKPYVAHEPGQDFLNSPHARFTGSLIQNAQHSADLSVSLSGTYASYFSQNPTDPTKNYGCVGCHDPHQSTVASVQGAKPIVQTCDQCHSLAKTILQTINHPTGPLTPFPTGTQADIPGACVTCHMQAALGRATSHLFRINTDASYRTYPTPDQFYTLNVNALGTATEYSNLSDVSYPAAAWQDVDLACGQCHVGGDGVTNPYNLTLPPGMPGAHAFTRAQLAGMAFSIHPGDPGVPAPTFSPTPGTYTTPISVSISDTQSNATIHYTTDGSLPNYNSPVYSAPIAISTTTSFRAIATYTGMPGSPIVYATYSINLPTAPPPLFSPPPSTYGSAQNVTLSNTANLAMYYTTDGSNPTTNSTPYSGPIHVTQNTTIKAMSAGYGYLNSPVATGNYYIQAPTPNISPASGTYYSAFNATISDTASGATIYYTTNGTTPTTGSTPCANPCTINVSSTITLKAIASGGGYVSSYVAVATYTFSASNPVFTPGPGTFYAPVAVTMTDSTPGVLIYYSTTGFPTLQSPSCASPCQILISTTTTLRAMAAGNGISQSGTTVGIYSIVAATPTLSPASGNYAQPLQVTISDTSPGVTVYYAINGFPTTSSPSCSSPCSVTVTGTGTYTVRAMAQGNGYSQGGTGVASYTLH